MDTEEKAEAEYLMRELIKRLKTQKAVAAKLGQTAQAFNYSLHHAQTVPLKRILAMRALLNELLNQEASPAFVSTPLIENTGLRRTLSDSGKKHILTDFNAMQNLLPPNYGKKASVKMVSTAIYCDFDLFEAEKNTQLPLRATFMGLLICCDKNGHFYWEPERLKAAILPYTPINFNQLLDSLCTCGFVQKKQISGRCFGYIPLKNRFVYDR